MSTVSLTLKIAAMLEAGTALAIASRPLVDFVARETDATRDEVQEVYDWAISRSERRLAEVRTAMQGASGAQTGAAPTLGDPPQWPGAEPNDSGGE